MVECSSVQLSKDLPGRGAEETGKKETKPRSFENYGFCQIGRCGELPDRKPWEELKRAEIADLKRRQCSKCDYYSKTENAWSVSATCDYILIEEHSRGCDPRDCVKNGIFKKKSRGKSRVKRVIL